MFYKLTDVSMIEISVINKLKKLLDYFVDKNIQMPFLSLNSKFSFLC